jgi:predicted dehydrogenase
MHARSSRESELMKIACIGAGRRLGEMLTGMVQLGIKVGVIADPNPDQVKARLKEQGIDAASIQFVEHAVRRRVFRCVVSPF